MNSYRCLKIMSLIKGVATSFLLLGSIYQVSAQEVGQGFPGVRINQNASEPPAVPVALPDGATIGGAKSKVQTLVRDAERSLNDLIGTPLDAKTDLEVSEMSAKKRRIMLLELDLKEAKLAKELWLEVNAEEAEESAEFKALEKKNADLEKALSEAKSQSASQNSPSPVIKEIVGSKGALSAVILVPYSGKVRADVGTILPNGMKVISISSAGVRVDANGTPKDLAFGSNVPMVRLAIPDSMN